MDGMKQEVDAGGVLSLPLRERLTPEERLEYAAHKIAGSVEAGELGYSLTAVRSVLAGLVAQAEGGVERPTAAANEIMLYGEIGEHPAAWLAELLGVEMLDNSARSVNSQLAKMTGDVTVRIFSYGGNYQQSVAIGQAFDTYRRRTGAQIITQVDAMAASAAAFIALRGNVRRIDSLGTMLFHEIRGTAKNQPASVFEAIAAEMRKMNRPLAAFVAGHTSLTLAEYEVKVEDGKDWVISAQEAEAVGGFTILDAGEKEDDAAAEDGGEMPEETNAPGDHFREREGAVAESGGDDEEAVSPKENRGIEWDYLAAASAF